MARRRNARKKRLPKKRSPLWWVAFITLPLVTVAGPIALAEAVSAIVDWRGWIAFLVDYWAEFVARPIQATANQIAGILHLPHVDSVIVDYVAFGSLLAGQKTRALAIFKHEIERLSDDAAILHLYPRNVVVTWLAAALLWPLIVVFDLGFLFPTSQDRLRARSHGIWVGDQPIRAENSYIRSSAFFALAPFTIFVALWVVNLAYY